MKKSNYKRTSSVKESYVQDRLKHKDIFCISEEWIRWAKPYINRSNRRNNKQQLKMKGEDY